MFSHMSSFGSLGLFVVFYLLFSCFALGSSLVVVGSRSGVGGG